MATVAELEEQLADAKYDLRWMARVSWGSANAGMVQYGSQLAKVHRLQLELNRAKGGG